MENDSEIVAWVSKHLPDSTEDECLDAYAIFRSYREEGQTMEVSMHYAGMYVHCAGEY